jgi:hypothetical protein
MGSVDGSSDLRSRASSDRSSPLSVDNTLSAVPGGTPKPASCASSQPRPDATATTISHVSSAGAGGTSEAAAPREASTIVGVGANCGAARHQAASATVTTSAARASQPYTARHASTPGRLDTGAAATAARREVIPEERRGFGRVHLSRRTQCGAQLVGAEPARAARIHVRRALSVDRAFHEVHEFDWREVRHGVASSFLRFPSA